jgi:hypothetical protein
VVAEPGRAEHVRPAGGLPGRQAGSAHVEGQHVKDFFGWAPDWVSAKPQIIYIDAPDLTGWGPMGEIEPRQQ